MIRAKPKKKKKDKANVSKHFILSVIMPCVMLACKDEFKIKDQKTLDRLADRIQRYINNLDNKSVSQEELHNLMRCKDISKENKDE